MSRLCPKGMEEVENYAGRPIARIDRVTHEVKQTHGECASASCKRRGWLEANKGQKWFCDEECRSFYNAQLAIAKKSAVAK